MTSSAPSASASAPPRFGARHWIALAAFAAAYCAFVIPQWGEAYLDFGDGNYMYIATRIADGVVVYRDMLAPQPPCHLFLGAAVVRASRMAGLETPLYLLRALSLLMHLATAWLVGDLARRSWGRSRTGVLAAAIYLALPIGLWWSMCWQSEPLEILFLLVMMRFAIRGTARADIAAGIFGALAALTNATAAPFLIVLIAYMLARDWRRALRIALPALALAGAVTAALEVWTGGYYLQNVLFNQAGTYPRNQFWGYAIGKLVREGADILWLEGFFVFLSIVGFFLFLKSSPLPRDARDGMAWFCAATFGSILYVTKGGTMDYIFCLAEPAVAILGAGAAMGLIAENLRFGISDLRDQISILEAADPPDESLKTGISNPKSPLSLRLAGLLLVAVFGLGPPISHYARIWNGRAWELPAFDPKIEANNVAQVKEWIDRHSKPGEAILAPPFYAFLTGRKIWGEYCELFIWRIKDLNDRMDKNPEGEGWTKTRALAAALERKEIPLAIIEMGQTGQLPEVAAALEKSYRPILEQPYRTLNTDLGVYVPKP